MLNKGCFTSINKCAETPQEFFDKLNAEFKFTLDPCASDSNHKCERYFTEKEDGLSQDWGQERVFCNPPFGREIGKWVKKCAEHKGLAVMLLPAWTDTRWFHEYIYRVGVSIRFIQGRLKFADLKTPAPFPSMIVIFRGGND